MLCEVWVYPPSAHALKFFSALQASQHRLDMGFPIWVDDGFPCQDCEVDMQNFENLRQILWGDENGDPNEELTQDQETKVRWIDTITMLADPLSKLKSAHCLEDAMSYGVLDLEPNQRLPR